MYDEIKEDLKNRNFESSVLSDMIGRDVDKSQVILAIETAINRRYSDIEFLNEVKTKLENEK